MKFSFDITSLWCLCIIMLVYAIVNTLVLGLSRKMDNPNTEKLSKANSQMMNDIYHEISWNDLIPKTWDVRNELRNLNWQNIGDEDPRADAIMHRMRKILDEAPAESSMNNTRVRIPGFVVPLEYSAGKIREFLLVPYFGACIHSPPPPANQIIHVFVDKPLVEYKSVKPYWVQGTLTINHASTELGNSSYQMQADKLELYDTTRETSNSWRGMPVIL